MIDKKNIETLQQGNTTVLLNILAAEKEDKPASNKAMPTARSRKNERRRNLQLISLLKKEI